MYIFILKTLFFNFLKILLIHFNIYHKIDNFYDQQIQKLHKRRG
jgi:hypothetical protein